MQRVEKFTMSIKIVDSSEGMYIFSQANENFWETLDRLEEMAKNKGKIFKQLSIKNTGMKFTVYE